MHDKKLAYNKHIFKIITEHTGYDFSGYAIVPLTRLLENFISKECVASPDELSHRQENELISYDKALGSLLVNQTELFRDTSFFNALRVNVLPFLSTYPKIKIWLAGCSTGEEVYSLAILLHELRLLHRCEIRATDLNSNAIEIGRQGIYSLQRIKEANARYYRSGGKKNLAAYYTAYYDHVIFDNRFRSRIEFQNQGIGDENEREQFHLIVCRNVYMYFNSDLQSRLVNSLSDNLFNNGFIGTGCSEELYVTKRSGLSIVDEENSIYRKII